MRKYSFGIFRVISMVLVMVHFINLNCYAEDRENWIDHRWSEESYLEDIAVSDDGLYVIAGQYGKIHYSKDAKEWVMHQTKTDNHFKGIAFGNGTFCAVTDVGEVFLSSDGVDWQLSEILMGDGRAIEFGNNNFVIIVSDPLESTYSDSGYWHTFYGSQDGFNWEVLSHEFGRFVEHSAISSINYVNEHFIIGDLFEKQIMISKDCEKWQYLTIDDDFSYSDVMHDGNDYIFVGTEYLRIDDELVAQIAFYITNDFINWEKKFANIDESLYALGIEKLGDVYYSVLANMDYSFIMSSKNLVEWTLEKRYDTWMSSSICTSNEDVLVGIGGEKIMTIKDGEVSTIVKPVQAPINIIAYDTGVVFADRVTGIYILQEGFAWENVKIFDNEIVQSFVYLGDKFYVLTRNLNEEAVTIYESADAINWTVIKTMPGDYSSKLYTCNDKLFVETTFTHGVWISEDGSDWTRIYNTRFVDDFAYCNDYYYLATLGDIYRSIDGVNWEHQLKLDYVNALATNGQSLIACKWENTFYYSDDGLNWTKHDIDGFEFSDVVWDGKHYVIFSRSGDYIKTTDGNDIQYFHADTLNSTSYACWTGKEYVVAGYSGALTSCVPTDLIKVIVNDKPVIFDVAPAIVNGRTMIPARAVFEKIGADVRWDGETRSVHIQKDHINIILEIDSQEASINGKMKELDSPATIVGGRTLVPIRFIAEELGMDVEWLSESQTVILKDMNNDK